MTTKKWYAHVSILMPGTKVKHYGTIGAVVWTGGERYYMMINAKGVVSLIPAQDVEKA